MRFFKSIPAAQAATAAADLAGAMVAPTLAYAPAPFNMAFPGTVSVSDQVFEKLVTEILEALAAAAVAEDYARLMAEPGAAPG